MKTKRMFLSVYFSLLFTTLVTDLALADSGLDWMRETNRRRCPPGEVVIDIFHKVVNDVDSAVGGGVWATDKYRRRVTVVQTDTDKFCAVTRYLGSFVTDDGKSPGGVEDALSAGIKGGFKGGYRTNEFTGELDPNPAHPTTGFIGTFNYGCDVETDPGDHSTCPHLFSWPGTYFTSTSGLDFDWWGWIYRTRHNGTWINACDGPDPDCPGNSGDITD